MLLSFLVQLLFRTHYARVELIILQPELRFNVLCVTNQWPVFYPIYHLLRLTTLFPRKKETSFNTSHNILALEALKKDPGLTVRAVAKIYNIPLSYDPPSPTRRPTITTHYLC